MLTEVKRIMIVEIGTYSRPDQVGYKAWAKFEKIAAFEGLDGEMTVKTL
jgi:hypothetical protein